MPSQVHSPGNDYRGAKECLTTRCMLNRKSYKSVDGKWYQRLNCEQSCKSPISLKNACKLTRQPRGSMVNIHG